MSEERETIKIVAGIIKHELGLRDDQVVIYNERVPIPKMRDLFVAVGCIGDRAFGSRIGHESRDDGKLWQVQSLNKHEILSINIMSFDHSARESRAAVVMALNSTFAQQEMEKYSMHIGRLPAAMNDISDIEGAGRLNRFVITANAHRLYRAEAAVDHYDRFPGPEIVTS
jgi:hypothetical protein